MLKEEETLADFLKGFFSGLSVFLVFCASSGFSISIFGFLGFGGRFA